MKIRNIIVLGLMAFGISSCDKFLDEMPDNRTTLDSEEKIVSLLSSAYFNSNLYCQFTELMSDNHDDIGTWKGAHSSEYLKQTYEWQDIDIRNNDAPYFFWGNAYSAISVANHALQAIDNLGGANTPELRACKAEALLARAYSAFMLVNVFCKNYNSQTSSKDLGIPYPMEPETTLDPKATRGTVAEVYQKIERDLEEALPNVSDVNFKRAPKYHFNELAAYAFACRFYLFYEKWDKAIEYANIVLGSAPRTMLRDYAEIRRLYPSGDAMRRPIENYYISEERACNLLLGTAHSYMGRYYGPWNTGKRYTHTEYLAENEDAEATHAWGVLKMYQPLRHYVTSTSTYYIFWRVPFLEEQLTTGSGVYYRTVIPLLTADEVLLNRAEAYTLQKNYDRAVADLNMWIANNDSVPAVLTADSIRNFYDKVEYSYTDNNGQNGLISTVKKHLHPAFAIDAEKSTQESLLQAILSAKRIEFMHLGLRWFDIKRYGIEIPRRSYNANGVPATVTDWLKVDDKRRAIQLPPEVISSGLEANPR